MFFDKIPRIIRFNRVNRFRGYIQKKSYYHLYLREAEQRSRNIWIHYGFITFVVGGFGLYCYYQRRIAISNQYAKSI